MARITDIINKKLGNYSIDKDKSCFPYCILTGERYPSKGGLYHNGTSAYLISSFSVSERNVIPQFSNLGVTIGDALVDSGLSIEQIVLRKKYILTEIESGIALSIENLKTTN